MDLGLNVQDVDRWAVGHLSYLSVENSIHPIGEKSTFRSWGRLDGRKVKGLERNILTFEGENRKEHKKKR